MTRVNETTEGRIIRSVHGELNEAESLELNREMLRRPELQSLKAEYEALDRITCEALGSVCERSRGTWVAPDARRRSGRLERAWIVAERWFVPSAVAAMIAIAVFLPGRRDERTGTALVRNNRTVGADHRAFDVPATNVSTAPTNVRRNTWRDVVGVVDKDGRFYILELDRTHTQRTPASSSTTSPPDGL